MAMLTLVTIHDFSLCASKLTLKDGLSLSGLDHAKRCHTGAKTRMGFERLGEHGTGINFKAISVATLFMLIISSVQGC